MRGSLLCGLVFFFRLPSLSISLLFSFTSHYLLMCFANAIVDAVVTKNSKMRLVKSVFSYERPLCALVL